METTKNMSKNKKKRLQRKEKFLKRKHFEKYLKKSLNKDSFNFENKIIKLDEFDKLLNKMGEDNKKKRNSSENKRKRIQQGNIFRNAFLWSTLKVKCQF